MTLDNLLPKVILMPSLACAEAQSAKAHPARGQLRQPRCASARPTCRRYARGATSPLLPTASTLDRLRGWKIPLRQVAVLRVPAGSAKSAEYARASSNGQRPSTTRQNPPQQLNARR